METMNNHGIVISDKVKLSTTPKDLIRDIDLDKIVLVHCTDRFPINHLIISSGMGNKIENGSFFHEGVTYDTQFKSYRPSVHFTLNHRVENTSNGEGKWDAPKYIIIEPNFGFKSYDEIQSCNDFWIDRSCGLSDKAVIMARLDQKENIESNRYMNDYNIIYYDGDPTICLNNYLISNGYDIIKGYANDIIHSCSINYNYEFYMENISSILYLFSGKVYLGQTLPEITKEELFTMFEMFPAESLFSNSVYEHIMDNEAPTEKEEYLYKKAVDFVLCTGLSMPYSKKSFEKNSFYTDNQFFKIKEINEKKELNVYTKYAVDYFLRNWLKWKKNKLSSENNQRPNINEYKDMTIYNLVAFNNSKMKLFADYRNRIKELTKRVLGDRQLYFNVDLNKNLIISIITDFDLNNPFKTNFEKENFIYTISASDNVESALQKLEQMLLDTKFKLEELKSNKVK